MTRNAFCGLYAAGSILLAALATACTDPSNIGNELPTDTDRVGVSYVDTFTVRTSTVLLDSIVSSSSSATAAEGNLLVGRYVDPRLGAVEAKAFTRLGLADGGFTALATDVYDSLVVTLSVDAYRYGDTTKVQQLRVHQVQAPFVDSRTYYTTSSLPYNEQPLGQRSFRPRPQLRSIRVRLNDALGRELFARAQRNELLTNAELINSLQGLVFTGAPTDNGAIVRLAPAGLSTADVGSGLQLYYHAAATPGEAEVYSFTYRNGAKRFYQLQADRRTSLLRPLTTRQQAISSDQTAGEVYIQEGLGLYTKVELPYLYDLKTLLGRNLIIVSAELAMESVQGTERGYAPLPLLGAFYTDRTNIAGTALQTITSAGQAAPITAQYRVSELPSPRTGLEQGTYTFPLTSYVQTILDRPALNTGFLLAPQPSIGVGRTVLGGRRNPTNPVQFRVYFARVD